MGAQKLREKLYPLAAARADDHWFTATGQTGSPLSGTTADFTAYVFAVHGYYNWRNIAIARAVCRPGDTILEVGANVGTETVGFSDIVGEEGVVHAFEPFPANVDQLRANAAQATSGNITVWPIALSDHEGRVRFVPPWVHNSGMGHVLGCADDATAARRKAAIELPCAKLDSLLSKLGPARLLAIDAEGHEVAILQGAHEYLGNHQPAIIIEVVEKRLALSGASPEDVARLLRDFGYHLFKISRFGIDAIGSVIGGTSRHGDWVALPISERGLVEPIARALRRCALMPMVRGLNPLCASVR